MNQIIKHLQPERISDSAGNTFIQNELFTGRELKQGGIQVAADHADRAHPGWQDQAINNLKYFLLWNNSPFMCETFRAFAEEECQLPPPPHARAYGAVMQRAQRVPAFIVAKTGTVHCFQNEQTANDGRVMLQVGKKKAGRLLDGVTHTEFPKVAV